jgi:FixJ family two-component response regulator
LSGALPVFERTVFVVDDDEAVRDALEMLFRSAGLRVESFASAGAFLRHGEPTLPSCLVLDIRMPHMSGTALHDELRRRGSPVPIIFVTGHGDIPLAVEAVKKGAYDFIEKPFDDDVLLQRVFEALGKAGGIRSHRDEGERLSRLSRRERTVLDLVLAGKPNRQIASELFISLKTVEFHRARIKRKLHAQSTADLFRICLRASLPTDSPPQA